MIANTDTTPRIGFDIGSTIDQNSRNGPGAVGAGRLEDLARQIVEEPLDQQDVERVRAGRQPDRPEGVDAATWPISGGCRIVRYSGTSSTTAGTNRVASTSPLRICAYFGRSTDEHVAAGRRDDELHDPGAERDPDRVDEVRADVDRRSRPSTRFAQSMPFGKSASGVRRVSCVGVIAAFASQSSGPSPR